MKKRFIILILPIVFFTTAFAEKNQETEMPAKRENYYYTAISGLGTFGEKYTENYGFTVELGKRSWIGLHWMFDVALGGFFEDWKVLSMGVLRTNFLYNFSGLNTSPYLGVGIDILGGKVEMGDWNNAIVVPSPNLYLGYQCNFGFIEFFVPLYNTFTISYANQAVIGLRGGFRF